MNERRSRDKIAIKHIAPENDDGNKEYKLKLFDSNPERLDRLLTQMRYRIDEGGGEAFYTIGVADDGGLVGLTENEYEKSREVLTTVAKKNDCSLSLISEQLISPTKKVYEFLIRERNPSKYIDIRVACAGSVDSGKTSLLGVLLTGQNDDGRGTARLNVFNFQHEVKTGRTSSVAQHILGFDDKGNPVNYDNSLGHKKGWTEIVSASSKVVTLFDLCGHEKYLKTTILGLTSQFPDVVFILVGGNMGLSKMSKEHIFLCLSLHIPFIVIITKIDICKDRKNVLEDTIKDVKLLVKSPGIRRIPYDIKSQEDVIVCSKNINSLATVPIFYVSNVTGEGVDYVRSFLNLFTKKVSLFTSENKVEMYVDQTFQVTGVGIIIGGQLIQGKIKIGDKLLIGPNNNVYTTIQVRSIHCKRTNVDEVDSGCYVCLGIKKPESLDIRRGQVIISILDRPIQVNEFEADIIVLKTHSTTIRVGYQPIVHVCSIRQTSQILSINSKKCARGQTDNDSILRIGDRATVRFRFCYKPEYIKKGLRILLVEGKLRLFGKITNVMEEVIDIE